MRLHAVWVVLSSARATAAEPFVQPGVRERGRRTILITTRMFTVLAHNAGSAILPRVWNIYGFHCLPPGRRYLLWPAQPQNIASASITDGDELVIWRHPTHRRDLGVSVRRFARPLPIGD